MKPCLYYIKNMFMDYLCLMKNVVQYEKHTCRFDTS